jgi:hypothetical protein
MNLTNIPPELRALQQWVCARPDKIPLDPKSGRVASVTDPSTWGSFEVAVSTGLNVGFVLTEHDPYCIIDLDNKESDPATQEQADLHRRILDAFDSYTELSFSGRGYHVVVRGRVPVGVHSRDKVEVYSSGRYMLFTGDVIRNAPITDQQALLDRLFAEMQPAPTAQLEEREELLTDDAVIEMAMSAVNGEKFAALARGEWSDLGYPSQSEADFALLSMLAFYSPSDEQVRRIFRMTWLGQRPKATHNNKYLDRALSKIRAQLKVHEVNIEGLKAKAQQVAMPPEQKEAPRPEIPPPAPITFPPGLVGEVAQYILDNAVRPVPEVALAAALGLCAGVAGRSYNVSGTGLNQYIILLAKTGSGKEGAQFGIDSLVNAIRPTIPMVDQFIGPGMFASGQALIRVLDDHPCFVSLLGEFGLLLKQICDPRANSAQVMLRRVLLDLYLKSGANSTLRSSVYSDKEKNTKMVQAPSLTILGESTPQSFYDELAAQHIAEGLIPRFSIIEYTGHRPPRNEHQQPPSKELLDRFSRLVVVALTTMNNRATCNVQMTDSARDLLDRFDRVCDSHINAGNDIEVELWNRAHLKVLKLSALVAVGLNLDNPVIDEACASWAASFVHNEVNRVASRFASGDVGTGDSKQVYDLRRIIEFYFTCEFDRVAPYEVDERLFRKRLLPYSYLSRRTMNLSSFRNDRLGATNALKRTIQLLKESDLIAEVPVSQMNKLFGSRAIAFALTGMSPANWYRLPNP